mmetsp:Transcript_77101/g.229726  ORF Transcript_77101/g.229726 Transcript_77101/m.229726 type:complete len:212 (-) Transcript_77101:242-877(-)
MAQRSCVSSSASICISESRTAANSSWSSSTVACCSARDAQRCKADVDSCAGPVSRSPPKPGGVPPWRPAGGLLGRVFGCQPLPRPRPGGLDGPPKEVSRGVHVGLATWGLSGSGGRGGTFRPGSQGLGVTFCGGMAGCGSCLGWSTSGNRRTVLGAFGWTSWGVGSSSLLHQRATMLTTEGGPATLTTEGSRGTWSSSVICRPGVENLSFW